MKEKQSTSKQSDAKRRSTDDKAQAQDNWDKRPDGMSAADVDLHSGTAREMVKESFANSGSPTDVPQHQEVSPANPGQSPAVIQHVADEPLPAHAKPQQMIPAGDPPGHTSPNPNV